MAYTSEVTVLKYVFNWSNLGLSAGTVTEILSQVDTIMDREIDIRWYRREAEEHSLDWRGTAAYRFDRDLLTIAPFAKAASYLAAHLAYTANLTANPDCAVLETAKLYRSMFNDELESVFHEGVEYEWVTPATTKFNTRGLTRA